MTAENKMLFPFTIKDEILYWATLYTEDQTPARQCQEKDVMKIRSSVEDNGYLTKTELMEMAHWKDPQFARSNIKKGNLPERIEAVTRDAFRPSDDWEKLEKLTDIVGVGESIASAILHLYNKGQYPILSEPARWSVGLERKKRTTYPFWLEYIEFCRDIANRNGVEMRTLDRALWFYSYDSRKC